MRALRGSFALALSAAVAALAAPPPELDPFDSGRPACRRYQDIDGLPQNTVHDFVLRRDGFLWAGTQDGAAFYDGQTWTRVDLPDAVRSNFVRSMHESADGDLWIGSQSGGLARLRGAEWTRFEPGDSGLPDDRVNAIAEIERGDGGRDLWFGTHEGGVARYDGESWSVYSTAAGLPSSQIWDLLPTGSGADRSLWIATGAGPAVLRLADRAVEVPAGAPHISVSALLETDEGGVRTLWVGTYGRGLWSFRDGSWKQHGADDGLPSEFVTDLAPSPSRGPGGFWIATDGGGVAVREGGRIRELDLGAVLSSRAAYRILETTEEQGARAVWIGTRNNGVIRVVDGTWRGFQPFPETENVPVNTLLLREEGDGRRSLWLGTDGYGLVVRRDGAWQRIDTASGAIGNDTVMVIAESRTVERRRLLWVGTRNGGLSSFDGRNWRRYGASRGDLPSDMVQAIVEEEGDGDDARLWVGTRVGLAAFDGRSWRHETGAGGPTGSVLALAVAAPPGLPRELWVGTTEGLWLRRGESWRSWGSRTGLANPSVQSLHFEAAPTGRRTLWVGTDGGGVWLLDPDDRQGVLHSLEDEGLPKPPNGSIYAIGEDRERRIYLLTNRGVTRIARPGVHQASARLEQFTTEHGLPMNQGNRGAGFVDADGRLWFGTVAGAVAFDPAREIADRSSNVLRLTGSPADCADCEIWNGQLFAHSENRFRFRLALLSYFAEPLTRYRTELGGSDSAPSDWTRSAEREVLGLGPGQYVLRAWGRDGAGNVSGPVELAFGIRPAPWQTPGARIAGAIAILGLVALLFRQRARVQQRREQDLHQKVEARTRQLQRANDHLIELSYVDPLTSVPNRRRFDELFAKEWQRSLRSKSPLGLVMFDLDEFKAYNDGYGHQQGDEALKAVASAMADGLVRSGDLVARYGGEEFAAILPSTDVAGAMRVAEQLRRRIEELQIPHESAQRRRTLTVSCGAVSAVATTESEPADLFRRADEAMYRAKRAGGNRTEGG